MTSTALSTPVLRDLYTKMLQTRIVDDYACSLYKQGYADFIPSCHGYEAAQVGSASCIKVGQDFTLPYYQDLGVVMTIGMVPYEVFRTYLHTQLTHTTPHPPGQEETVHHWGYHKHNTITGPAPVATQLLHAAGIAFACKLRKAKVATVAYCNSDAIVEPDFHEGIRFAAQQHLPVVFICERAYSIAAEATTVSQLPPSCLQDVELPQGLAYQHLNGSDVVAVYTAMQQALQDAREAYSPTLLEIAIPQLHANSLDSSYTETVLSSSFATTTDEAPVLCTDPLLCCQRYLEQQGAWDEDWHRQVLTRISLEVERALQDALRDVQPVCK